MSECQACVTDCDRALMFDPTHVKATVRRALANEYLESTIARRAISRRRRGLDPETQSRARGSRRVAPFL